MTPTLVTSRGLVMQLSHIIQEITLFGMHGPLIHAISMARAVGVAKWNAMVHAMDMARPSRTSILSFLWM